jgi:hypothetical protein
MEANNIADAAAIVAADNGNAIVAADNGNADGNVNVVKNADYAAAVDNFLAQNVPLANPLPLPQVQPPPQQALGQVQPPPAQLPPVQPSQVQPPPPQAGVGGQGQGALQQQQHHRAFAQGFGAVQQQRMGRSRKATVQPTIRSLVQGRSRVHGPTSSWAPQPQGFPL